MKNIEVIVTKYYVHEIEYDIKYDLWDSHEVERQRKTYGPYYSKDAAERKRHNLKVNALKNGWNKSCEEYLLIHKFGEMSIDSELSIVIEEKKKNLGNLEKYLKKRSV